MLHIIIQIYESLFITLPVDIKFNIQELIKDI